MRDARCVRWRLRDDRPGVDRETDPYEADRLGRSHGGCGDRSERGPGLERTGQGVVCDRRLRDPGGRTAIVGGRLCRRRPASLPGHRPGRLEGAPHQRWSAISVTVPVRRGGLLSLLLPIPPATISFQTRAVVHPAGSIDIASRSKKLASLLPSDRRAATLIELVPEGSFLTYGIGVSLKAMMDPATALAHVPIG